MTDPILRKEILPFVCQNPNCGEEYDLEGFQKVLDLWGIVYADCGDFVAQGITCPKCLKTSIASFPRNDIFIDLRDFLITPSDYLDIRPNLFEQIQLKEAKKNENEMLRFKFIPAWIDEELSYEAMLKYYQSQVSQGLNRTIGIPYKMTSEECQYRSRQENETGEIQLRRLYPDKPKFRNLLLCISPKRFEGIESAGDGSTVYYAQSYLDNEELKEA